MVHHAHGVENLPMWNGFNAKKCVDPFPKQKISYMANLKQPLTSLDTIQETLVVTQICAQECGQKFEIVSYDLGAAKPAM